MDSVCLCGLHTQGRGLGEREPGQLLRVEWHGSLEKSNGSSNTPATESGRDPTAPNNITTDARSNPNQK